MNSKAEFPWPRVLTVEPLSDYKIRITIAGQENFLLNLKNLIMKRDAYWRLRKEKYFRQVGIDSAGALCWPGGEDLAPEALERYRVEN